MTELVKIVWKQTLLTRTTLPNGRYEYRVKGNVDPDQKLTYPTIYSCGETADGLEIGRRPSARYLGLPEKE